MAQSKHGSVPLSDDLPAYVQGIIAKYPDDVRAYVLAVDQTQEDVAIAHDAAGEKLWKVVSLRLNRFPLKPLAEIVKAAPQSASLDAAPMPKSWVARDTFWSAMHILAIRTILCLVRRAYLKAEAERTPQAVCHDKPGEDDLRLF